MSDIKIDSSGDIEESNGDLSLTTGTDSIDQFLRQKLRTFFGEWFLDNRVGLPYFQQIFQKDFDIDIIDSAFKREILTTNGVLELLEFFLKPIFMRIELYSSNVSDSILLLIVKTEFSLIFWYFPRKEIRSSRFMVTYPFFSYEIDISPVNNW